MPYLDPVSGDDIGYCEQLILASSGYTCTSIGQLSHGLSMLLHSFTYPRFDSVYVVVHSDERVSVVGDRIFAVVRHRSSFDTW